MDRILGNGRELYFRRELYFIRACSLLTRQNSELSAVELRPSNSFPSHRFARPLTGGCELAQKVGYALNAASHRYGYC